MALYIRTNNAVANVTPQNSVSFTLEELQRMVGGLIEVVHLETDELMICNEEGKILYLPYNQAATRMARTKGHDPHDRIMGNVVICSAEEMGERG